MAGLDALSVIAAAAGVAVALIGRRLGAAAAGGWAALLLVGQAAMLRLVEAGPVVAYQHFPTLDRFAFDAIAFAVLGLQLVLVAAGLARCRSRLADAVRGRPAWQLAVIAAVTVGLCVAPSADPGAYAFEIAVGGGLRLLAIANAGVLWFALPDSLVDRVASGWRGAGEGSAEPRIDRVGLSLAAGVTLVCALLAVTVYERHPHVPDEISYLYQARAFAAGALDMPAPPVRGAFEVDLMSYEADRWFSPVPPGWGGALSVGVRLGVPWLVNPVLAGIGVLLSYLVGWRLYDRRVGALAAGLLAVSPWYLFLGMSLMTHLTSFVCAVACVNALLAWRDRGGLWRLGLAGAFMGGVALVRPLEAVVVGLLVGAAVLRLARGRRLIPSAAVLGIGAAAITSLLIPFHVALTGSATRFPINAYVDAVYEPGANALGFGANRGLGWTGLDPFPGHGPRDVVVNAILNGHATDIELFGWAIGAWVLVLAGLLWRKPTRIDLWVIAAFALPILIHVPYWFAGGPDFGARYWFLIILPLTLLTARALTGSSDRTAARGLMVAAALTISAMATFVPWRAVDKYSGYRGMRPWARAIAADPAMANALVLVRGARQPDFASAVIYNPLDLTAPGPAPVFAWARDPAARDSAIAAYPGRRVYVLEGPTITGGPARLVPAAGDDRDPLPAGREREPAGGS